MQSESALPMRSERGPIAGLLLLAAAGISYILEDTNGTYTPVAVVAVVVCWLLALLALFARDLRAKQASAHWLTTAVLIWGLLQCGFLFFRRQDSDGRMFAAKGQLLFQVGIGLAALATLAVWLLRDQKPRLQSVALYCGIGLHFALALGVLRMAKAPHIDVWTVEMDAAKALVSGVNPFTITFPDPYHGTSNFFPAGVSVDGRLQFGFVYPPLTLLLCLPGYLFGDTRFSTLAAMTLSAILIARARPGTLASLSALVLLFMPRTFYVLHRAWTDPTIVLATAAVVYLAIRAPKYMYIAAGLYCCLKQHMFIGAPALILLLPQPWSLRQVAVFYAKVGAVGLLVTLPLALWDFPAFVNSVLNIREVFRTDSLGVLALLANTGVAHLSKWTGIGVAAVVGALCVWRAPRTPAGFALAAGLTHFSLYLFSTHAFCNEYYNVFGSLCIVLGLGNGEPVLAAGHPRADEVSGLG
jgi:hypothetical protein